MSESKLEEILMLLAINCAFMAYLCEFKTLATVLAIKAFFDFLAVIYYAVKEIKSEQKEKP